MQEEGKSTFSAAELWPLYYLYIDNCNETKHEKVDKLMFLES